jgi:hypothetical protein
MTIIFFIWRLLWKTAVVAAAVVLGALGASGVGWHGAEMIAKLPLTEILVEFLGFSFGDDSLIVTFLSAGVGAGVKFCFSAAMCLGPSFLVYKIAKPVLFIMVPILLWVAIGVHGMALSAVLT